MPKFFNYTPSGFTLIELLITVSIMGILSAMVFPGFTSFADNQQVQQQTLNVVSDAELAKNKALGGAYSTGTTPTSSAWGIIFCSGNNSTYALRNFNLTGGLPAPGTSGASDFKSITLQGGVVFDCGGSPKTWVFERLTGKPITNGGPITLIKGSFSRIITLNPSGSISISN